MPRRTDIKKILLIGSGPIIIGQACEFDYSGTQACKALREEGYEVVLVNSNPATIMTDPEMADRTYIEPLTWEVVAKVIEVERPDALLPTLGGQTGLNLAMDLARHGVLEKFGVEMIGANAAVIAKAEQRDQFKAAMEKIGLECCRGETVTSLEEGRRVLAQIGLPCVLRPSFTLGGTGSSIAYNRDEFDRLLAHGLEASPVSQVLLEESVIGWKEYEMEVMRDKDDNCRDHLLDREFRPHGRAHRRLDHRGPRPDAHRQGIPADARRLDRRDAGDRRRDGRLEHPVRRRSPQRADGRDRDEPAGQPLQRLGLQGHRFSHRQDRRQAGRRLSPARAAQRHHAGDEGLLRAHDRLRGDQGPPLRLREIPRGRLPCSPRR